MPEEILGERMGTGVAVNYLALENEPPDDFLAIRFTQKGQEIVMRDTDPARLADRLRSAGIEAVITTSGKGYETTVF